MNALDLQRLHRAQCRLAATALERILPGERAADAVLHGLLRGDRRLGARDRRWVTALVYGVLRDVHALREMLGADAGPQRLIAGWLAWRMAADAARLADLGLDADAASLDPARLSRAARRNWLPTLDALLQAELGGEEAGALAAALRLPAPVVLRVNALRATRQQVREALAGLGIGAEPTPLAPHGLQLAGRQPLAATAVWRDGWIEPQDEGSQLVAALVAARPGERIADWCAGAGGKALAMAADMRDQGRIDAYDIDAARLARIGPRAQRLGVHCIRPAAYDDLDAAGGGYDAVLVDAPCSGTGTLRRQPELALRDPDLAHWNGLQSGLLERAAAQVAVGGRLVYATCSLLRAENEAVTTAFLAAHPQFEIEPADAVLAAQGIVWQGEALRLWPHHHGSDGFYALRMRRRG